MPTGYTAKLVEDGQEFPDFAMTCARAFGALISLRDEPMDTPIPEEFEPMSGGYHQDQITEAKRKLAEFEKMTAEEQHGYGQSVKLSELTSLLKCLETAQAENKRIDDMVAKVTAWTPPSGEHVGLREFMLQQLGTSRNGTEYYAERITEIENQSPQQIFDAALEGAKSDIKYHEKHHREEVKNAKTTTLWVKQLRDSLRTYRGQ